MKKLYLSLLALVLLANVCMAEPISFEERIESEIEEQQTDKKGLINCKIILEPGVSKYDLSANIEKITVTDSSATTILERQLNTYYSGSINPILTQNEGGEYYFLAFVTYLSDELFPGIKTSYEIQFSGVDIIGEDVNVSGISIEGLGYDNMDYYEMKVRFSEGDISIPLSRIAPTEDDCVITIKKKEYPSCNSAPQKSFTPVRIYKYTGEEIEYVARYEADEELESVVFFFEKDYDAFAEKIKEISLSIDGGITQAVTFENRTIYAGNGKEFVLKIKFNPFYDPGTVYFPIHLKHDYEDLGTAIDCYKYISKEKAVINILQPYTDEAEEKVSGLTVRTPQLSILKTNQQNSIPVYLYNPGKETAHVYILPVAGKPVELTLTQERKIVLCSGDDTTINIGVMPMIPDTSSKLYSYLDHCNLPKNWKEEDYPHFDRPTTPLYEIASKCRAKDANVYTHILKVIAQNYSGKKDIDLDELTSILQYAISAAKNEYLEEPEEISLAGVLSETVEKFVTSSTPDQGILVLYCNKIKGGDTEVGHKYIYAVRTKSRGGNLFGIGNFIDDIINTVGKFFVPTADLAERDRHLYVLGIDQGLSIGVDSFSDISDFESNLKFQINLEKFKEFCDDQPEPEGDLCDASLGYSKIPIRYFHEYLANYVEYDFPLDEATKILIPNDGKCAEGEDTYSQDCMGKGATKDGICERNESPYAEDCNVCREEDLFEWDGICQENCAGLDPDCGCNGGEADGYCDDTESIGGCPGDCKASNNDQICDIFENIFISPACLGADRIGGSFENALEAKSSAWMTGNLTPEKPMYYKIDIPNGITKMTSELRFPHNRQIALFLHDKNKEKIGFRVDNVVYNTNNDTDTLYVVAVSRNESKEIYEIRFRFEGDIGCGGTNDDPESLDWEQECEKSNRYREIYRLYVNEDHVGEMMKVEITSSEGVDPEIAYVKGPYDSDLEELLGERRKTIETSDERTTFVKDPLKGYYKIWIKGMGGWGPYETKVSTFEYNGENESCEGNWECGSLYCADGKMCCAPNGCYADGECKSQGEWFNDSRCEQGKWVSYSGLHEPCESDEDCSTGKCIQKISCKPIYCEESETFCREDCERVPSVCGEKEDYCALQRDGLSIISWGSKISNFECTKEGWTESKNQTLTESNTTVTGADTINSFWFGEYFKHIEFEEGGKKRIYLWVPNNYTTNDASIQISPSKISSKVSLPDQTIQFNEKQKKISFDLPSYSIWHNTSFKVEGLLGKNHTYFSDWETPEPDYERYNLSNPYYHSDYMLSSCRKNFDTTVPMGTFIDYLNKTFDGKWEKTWTFEQGASSYLYNIKQLDFHSKNPFQKIGDSQEDCYCGLKWEAELECESDNDENVYAYAGASFAENSESDSIQCRRGGDEEEKIHITPEAKWLNCTCSNALNYGPSAYAKSDGGCGTESVSGCSRLSENCPSNYVRAADVSFYEAAFALNYTYRYLPQNLTIFAQETFSKQGSFNESVTLDTAKRSVNVTTDFADGRIKISDIVSEILSYPWDVEVSLGDKKIYEHIGGMNLSITLNLTDAIKEYVKQCDYPLCPIPLTIKSNSPGAFELHSLKISVSPFERNVSEIEDEVEFNITITKSELKTILQDLLNKSREFEEQYAQLNKEEKVSEWSALSSEIYDLLMSLDEKTDEQAVKDAFEIIQKIP